MVKIDVGKYLTPKAILNLFILLGFLVFITMVLFTLGQEIKSKAQTIQEQRAEIESRISSISRLADLTAAAKEAEPALADLNALLPKRDDLVTFPRYIDTLASQNQVEDRFSFGGEVIAATETEAGRSSFTLSIIGSYANILGFLEQLERGRFIIKVEALDVIIQREGTSFEANIQGSVFFRD